MSRTLPRTLVSLAIFAFLIFYSAQKYLAAAPAGLNLTYILSVLVLVGLTAVIPLVLTLLVAPRVPAMPLRLALSAGLPLVLSAAGLFVYWIGFLSPNFGVPLEAVMPRAIFPGVSLAALMVLFTVTTPRAHADPAPSQAKPAGA